MTREEHEKLLAKILENAKDPAAVSEALTALREDYGATLADVQLTHADNDNLKKRNKEVTEQNMQLFLKVGHRSAEQENQEHEDKKREYSDLFDENGKLKVNL